MWVGANTGRGRYDSAGAWSVLDWAPPFGIGRHWSEDASSFARACPGISSREDRGRVVSVSADPYAEGGRSTWTGDLP